MMLTIREFCEKHKVPRARVKYWLVKLEKDSLARKTGDYPRAPWLIDEQAVDFLLAEHKPGPKPKIPCEGEAIKWLEIYNKHNRSVNATAQHFGVTWQTAARRLDLYGIRVYKKRPRS